MNSIDFNQKRYDFDEKLMYLSKKIKILILKKIRVFKLKKLFYTKLTKIEKLEYQKEYYQKNKEKILDNRKKYFLKNKEKINTLTKIEKLEIFKNAGWKYNPETGEVTSHKNRTITHKNCVMVINNKKVSILKNSLAWYLTYGTSPSLISHINGNLDDDRLINLSTIRKVSTKINNTPKLTPIKNTTILTRIEKLEIFKNAGWKYNPETGEVTSHKNKIVKNNICKIQGNNITQYKSSLGWYLTYGTTPMCIRHLNGDLNDNRLINLSEISKVPTKKDKPPKLTKIKNIKKIQNTKINKINNKIKKINKFYLKDVDLTYNILISQGKGYLTTEAINNLLIMVDNVVKKFNYKSIDTQYDCKMNAILTVLERWNNFNYLKYQSAFSYFTEVIKRALAEGINILTQKNHNKTVPRFISLSNWNY